MSLSQRPNARLPHGPARLPIRWAVILGFSAAIGGVVGWLEGIAFGICAGMATLGVLHKIIK